MYLPVHSSKQQTPNQFTDKAREEVISIYNRQPNNNNAAGSGGSSISGVSDNNVHTVISGEPPVLAKTKSRILPSFRFSSKVNNKDSSSQSRLGSLSGPLVGPADASTSTSTSSSSSLLKYAHGHSENQIQRSFTNSTIESTYSSRSSNASIFSKASFNTQNTLSTIDSNVSGKSRISLPSINDALSSTLSSTEDQRLFSNNNSSGPVAGSIGSSNQHQHQKQLLPPLHAIHSGIPVAPLQHQLLQQNQQPQQPQIPPHPKNRENGFKKSMSLERVISDIKDYNLFVDRSPTSGKKKNVGFEVFNQLNEIIAKVLQIEAVQLIDWNLNLIRCLLMINEIPPNWDVSRNEGDGSLLLPEITVNGNRHYKIQDGFQSELVKLIASYRRSLKNNVDNYQKFKNLSINFKNFIKNVMSDRFLVFEKKIISVDNVDKKFTLVKFNKNIKEEILKLQYFDINSNDKELISDLCKSDLFKEFNLDTSFKLKVATISVEQARYLQNTRDRDNDNGNDENKNNNNENDKCIDDDTLSVELRILALRNYFLNLLVASQTLLEFHYAINDLLNKEEESEAHKMDIQNDKTPIDKEKPQEKEDENKNGLEDENDDEVSEQESKQNALSENECKFLWDNIRERNFKKIECFF
ncbi:hypothetical protein PACTADRAFT_50166 [Pachysolen tannophilus NRRL Y-2460]|uniref:Uncharacterized protein n=1 Tax=Pachysolen tannophilus NRRL Y-2460 TaxID=669874 RepID=A0A1E4TUP0_PACTA|nr:hypothetical protein PACTADRAFT_50166 [Pachysolen tannophilus NRRL Y-2460]